MKRFLKKLLLLMLLFVGVHVVLLTAIPADRNQYLNEYNHKIELLRSTPSPRVIFIGGSNTAFALDSRRLEQTLHRHVVNMGLHAGIGIRYPMDDALQFLRQGDVVVLQIEYGVFYGGTCNAETMPKLMAATGWRNATHLTPTEWQAVVAGMPMMALSCLKRLVLFPIRKSFNTPVPEGRFGYAASGFNEYGDEVSHWTLPGDAYVPSGGAETRQVSQKFMGWLQQELQAYEARGARVIVLPPVCVSSYFSKSYQESIAQALQQCGYPYAAQPAFLTLPDSLAFNTGYHINRQGVRTATERIGSVLDSLLNM